MPIIESLAKCSPAKPSLQIAHLYRLTLPKAGGTSTFLRSGVSEAYFGLSSSQRAVSQIEQFPGFQAPRLCIAGVISFSIVSFA